MFAIIYRWRVEPAGEKDFQRAWEVLTREYLASSGSLGSRLHRASDGTWLAYAQWPDRSTWEQATVTSDEGQAALGLLMAAVKEHFEPLLLDAVSDHLVGMTPD